MIVENGRQINKWIREERALQGRRLKDVAEAAMVTPQCICSIERDARQCSIDSFISISMALGYRIELVKENTDGTV